MDLKKIGYKFKRNLITSTAILTLSTPTSALLETAVGMDDDVSLYTRLMNAGALYAGFGILVEEWRDKWREYFKIRDETKGKIQGNHDKAYFFTLQLMGLPFFYYMSGARDPLEMGAATILGGMIGGQLGYSMDAFKDFMEIKETTRLPSFIRKINPKVKKGLAALLVATSIGLTWTIYSLTPDKNQEAYQKQSESIETIVDQGTTLDLIS